MFNKSGKFINSFGRKGEGPGEFKYPIKIDSVNEKIIISEINKFNVFSEEGKFLKMREFRYTDAPITFINEDIYIFKGKNINNISVLKKKDLKIGEQLELAEFDLGGKTIKNMIVQKNGVAPVCSYLDNIYYGKGDSCTIVKIDQLGNELNSFFIKGRQRETITREEKIEKIGKKIFKRLKSINIAGKSALDAYLKSIPNKNPFYNKLTVTKKGFIFAFIPGKKDGLKIDVFSLKGKYLYRSVLKLPDSIKIKKTPIFYENFLYAFTENEEGELKLIKYTIKMPEV